MGNPGNRSESGGPTRPTNPSGPWASGNPFGARRRNPQTKTSTHSGPRNRDRADRSDHCAEESRKCPAPRCRCMADSPAIVFCAVGLREESSTERVERNLQYRPHNFPAEHTSHGRFVRLTLLFESDDRSVAHALDHDANLSRDQVKAPAETCPRRPTR